MGTEYVEGVSPFSYLKKSEIIKIHETLKTFGPVHYGLEIGCGTGGLTLELTQKIAGQWTGLDISETAIVQAKQRCNTAHHNTHFVVGSINCIPFPAAHFDCIIVVDAIQHGKPYAHSVKEIRRVLKPNGKLLFTNWVRKLPFSQLIKTDPLCSELLNCGFNIHSITDTDPGLHKQIKVYIEIYERRTEFERELGGLFLEMMFREAHHIGRLRNSIQRVLTIASAP